MLFQDGGARIVGAQRTHTIVEVFYAVIICRSHLTSQILASARSESFLAVLEGCHF